MKPFTSTLVAAAMGLLASTRADAAPFDIVQCMTISQPGLYRLAADLQSAADDCIVVLINNVSIDLAGFTIRGRSRGVGIRARSPGERSPAGDTFTSTMIRGGTVTGFDTGLELAKGAVVEHMHIVGNTHDGIRAPRGLLTARYNTIRRNARSPDRRSAGIVAGANSLITDNVVSAHGRANKGIAYTCPSVVIHNVVSAIGPWSHQRNATASDQSSDAAACIVEKNVTGAH